MLPQNIIKKHSKDQKVIMQGQNYSEGNVMKPGAVPEYFTLIEDHKTYVISVLCINSSCQVMVFPFCSLHLISITGRRVMNDYG